MLITPGGIGALIATHCFVGLLAVLNDIINYTFYFSKRRPFSLNEYRILIMDDPYNRCGDLFRQTAKLKKIPTDQLVQSIIYQVINKKDHNRDKSNLSGNTRCLFDLSYICSFPV